MSLPSLLSLSHRRTASMSGWVNADSSALELPASDSPAALLYVKNR